LGTIEGVQLDLRITQLLKAIPIESFPRKADQPSKASDERSMERTLLDDNRPAHRSGEAFDLLFAADLGGSM
jgi:hypothetical protein